MPVVFPIAYLGSLDYFRALVKSETIVFEVDEHYIKQTVRNRTTILTANGLLALSIPVVKVNGSKTKTRDIRIDENQNWRKTHWKAIESAYAHSPYFEHYGSEVESFLMDNKPESLMEFHENGLKLIQKWLDLPISWSYSKDFSRSNSETYLADWEKFRVGMVYNYQQVFQESKTYFQAPLSILDAIFNLGPMARKLLIE